jgi:hypothetical protein
MLYDYVFFLHKDLIFFMFVNLWVVDFDLGFVI